MAYATNLASIGVRTNNGRPQFYHPGSDIGVPERVFQPTTSLEQRQARQHLTNAIRLYERAIVLLKESTNSVSRKEWLVPPLELGHAWCLDQAGMRREALVAYRRALAFAWKKEVTGEFSFVEWVQDKWNAVKSGNNPLATPNRRRGGGIGDICFSEEIIRYVLALLDPVEDAREITDLKEKQKTLATMSRLVTPILVPLADDAPFRELVDTNAAVPFDLDGSGTRRSWNWLTPKAAWLVFDREGRGEITSALQMFGNVTFWIFWRDGYAALSSLDDDHDGTLRGCELDGIAVWHDQNVNGISEPGEVRPIAEWNVVAISCRGEADAGGMPWSSQGVTFSDGTTRPTYDWIATAARVPIKSQ